jgi:hypothetical protein
MFTLLRITTLVLSLLPVLAGCSKPLRIQSDFVPPGSLRVAQVTMFAQREDILKSEALYKSIIAAGVADSDLVDGSVVVARIYCCGGISKELSSEVSNSLVLYVPKEIKVGLGDFVEVKVGRPPKNGDKGSLNTVTRVVAKYKEKPETCWWDPKDDRLWLRVIYCDWMGKEGWHKQGGVNPAWFKPVP